MRTSGWVVVARLKLGTTRYTLSSPAWMTSPLPRGGKCSKVLTDQAEAYNQTVSMIRKEVRLFPKF